MQRNLQNGLSLLAFLALAGCVSSGVIERASPVMVSTPVSVDFALVETSSAISDLETEKKLLNEFIVSDLRGHDIFGDVGGDPASAGASTGIKIKVAIKGIKKLSRSEREWGGALAGRAFISVEVTVSDLNSGKLIEIFEAKGESSGGSNLAGTTDEAVQRAAEQVVAQVIQISRQTGD